MYNLVKIITISMALLVLQLSTVSYANPLSLNSTASKSPHELAMGFMVLNTCLFVDVFGATGVTGVTGEDGVIGGPDYPPGGLQTPEEASFKYVNESTVEQQIVVSGSSAKHIVLPGQKIELQIPSGARERIDNYKKLKEICLKITSLGEAINCHVSGILIICK